MSEASHDKEIGIETVSEFYTQHVRRRREARKHQHSPSQIVKQSTTRYEELLHTEKSSVCHGARHKVCFALRDRVTDALDE